MARLTKENNEGDIAEIRCPNCGEWQPLESYRMYTVNPHYIAELTPVLQCQNDVEDRTCMHIFAPTILNVKARHDLLKDVKTE